MNTLCRNMAKLYSAVLPDSVVRDEKSRQLGPSLQAVAEGKYLLLYFWVPGNEGQPGYEQIHQPEDIRLLASFQSRLRDELKVVLVVVNVLVNQEERTRCRDLLRKWGIHERDLPIWEDTDVSPYLARNLFGKQEGQIQVATGGIFLFSPQGLAAYRTVDEYETNLWQWFADRAAASVQVKLDQPEGIDVDLGANLQVTLNGTKEGRLMQVEEGAALVWTGFEGGDFTFSLIPPIGFFPDQRTVSLRPGRTEKVNLKLRIHRAGVGVELKGWPGERQPREILNVIPGQEPRLPAAWSDDRTLSLPVGRLYHLKSNLPEEAWYVAITPPQITVLPDGPPLGITVAVIPRPRDGQPAPLRQEMIRAQLMRDGQPTLLHFALGPNDPVWPIVKPFGKMGLSVVVDDGAGQRLSVPLGGQTVSLGAVYLRLSEQRPWLCVLESDGKLRIPERTLLLDQVQLADWLANTLRIEKAIYPDGSRYVGNMVKGKKNGWGCFFGANGDRYEGEWKDDHEHGRGILTRANGESYEGEWEKGRESGQGTRTWANGDQYTGEWVNGFIHGYGTYTWANGDQYTGTWKNGQRNGQGTFFKNFQEGTSIWPAGSIYEGAWENDKPSVPGGWFWHDGIKTWSYRFKGRWIHYADKSRNRP